MNPKCLPFRAAAVVLDPPPLCLSLAGAASAACVDSSSVAAAVPPPRPGRVCRPLHRGHAVRRPPVVLRCRRLRRSSSPTASDLL
ncbi:hypothetical protein LINPERHAP2_LOCUS16317 [Linum perenne]